MESRNVEISIVVTLELSTNSRLITVIATNRQTILTRLMLASLMY